MIKVKNYPFNTSKFSPVLVYPIMCSNLYQTEVTDSKN